MIPINQFPEALIPFEVFYLKNTKILWLDRNEVGSATSRDEEENCFLKRFSYYTSSKNSLLESLIDKNNKMIVAADRYGGAGINRNGGSARSGIINNFQVKGIGKNALAAEENDVWHSYGGLSAIDAVYEAAISKVCNNILPVGTIDYLGIILTGEATAYYYDLTFTHGALLVREAAVRPAHFMRNALYENSRLTKDNTRTRFCCEKLLAISEGEKGVTTIIQKFVSSCANQFAFSILIRLFHGSISPSNICIDGRWLDLTNSGFTPSGINYGGPIPVHEEWQKIAGIIDEIVYSVNKYAKLRLSSLFFVQSYFDLFDKYVAFHLPAPLGLPYLNRPEENEKKIYLIGRIFKVIGGSGRVETDWPDQIKACDPFLELLKDWYLTFVIKNLSCDQCDDATFKISSELDYQDFENLVFESYKKIKEENSSINCKRLINHTFHR